MPSNADLLREQYEATNERDWRRVMSYYTDDVVLVIHGEGIRSGTYAGREALGKWFGEWFSTFDRDASFEIRELTEFDDGSVGLAAEHHARGRASGVQMHGTVAWLHWFRDGKIGRVEGNTELYDLRPSEAMERLRRQAAAAAKD